MRRRFLFVLGFVLAAFAAWAANVKLYLKDGGYQLVREYQAQSDRVRFYSVERSEWEEMPLDLVDLKRTEAESASRQAAMEKETKLVSEENQADSRLRDEVSRIPRAPGVYWVEGAAAKVLKQAESTVHTEKGRFILRSLSPMPTTTGKTAALEVDGAHSTSVFANPEQEFYIQLSETERFGIARLTPKGTARIAETISYMAGTNEAAEEPEMVATLQLELADGLYKIWPKEPLPGGEYAVVQYTEGKIDMQIWDFAVKGK
jgi:hypothetical protein